MAVLRLPNDPLFCYEFSYNRTSHIDGTKFYACLQCRKAKAESKLVFIFLKLQIYRHFLALKERGGRSGEWEEGAN